MSIQHTEHPPEAALGLTPRQRSAAIGLLVLGLCVAAYLPSLGARIYASPDETAQAVAAHELALHGRAFIPEDQVVQFPWLHPRSWVSQPGRIVPVGFLGWTGIASPFVRLLGDGVLPWLGGLIMLSGGLPLFFLLKRWGFWPAWWGTLATLGLPNVLLYLNRGMFPNGPGLGLFLWVCWLLQRAARPSSAVKRRAWAAWLLIGVLAALAIAIRPTEMAWMVPWWIWCARGARLDRRVLVALVLGGMLCGFPFFLLADQTYGSWERIGYLLHDLPWSVAGAAPSVSASSGFHPWQVLPFGFHPTHIWWNVRSFALGLLGPWTLSVLAAFGLWLYGRSRDAKRSLGEQDVFMLLVAWTVASLLAIYGSGLYTDHSGRDLATIGNSFLRYLLPLSPLVGVCAAWIVARYPAGWRHRVILGWVIVLCLFGAYRAYVADDEGLAYTRRELGRYVQIRQQVMSSVPMPDVVLSDRSDKVFFPVTRAVSPLPPADEIARLLRTTGWQVGLFIRPPSQSELDRWRSAGLQLIDDQGFDGGRERFYHVLLRQL